MDNNPHDSDLLRKFGEVSPEVTAELQSMLRIFNVDADELYYKWDAYGMAMEIEPGTMSLDSVRAFKKHYQQQLDKEMQAKKRLQQNQTAVHRTPRAPAAAAGGDMFEEL